MHQILKLEAFHQSHTRIPSGNEASAFEDFWKPGKSEWDSEILDITNKQRELEESQYVKSRSNEAYCYLLSELYPMAEKVAYAQG